MVEVKSMQPCQVCGGMAVDQNGYCTQCGTFRGQVTQPVSGAPQPGYPYASGPAPASGAPWPSQTSAAPYPFSGPPVSGTPGYPPPTQRRPVTLILVAACALVVVLIGAIVVVALARSGKHADGTVTDDYSKAGPYTGSYNGHSITMTVTGTVQSRITTANGTLTFHDIKADGTVSYKVDGTAVGSAVPLDVSNDPVQYTCLTKTATEHTDHYDVTLTKISDSP